MMSNRIKSALVLLLCASVLFLYLGNNTFTRSGGRRFAVHDITASSLYGSTVNDESIMVSASLTSNSVLELTGHSNSRAGAENVPGSSPSLISHHPLVLNSTRGLGEGVRVNFDPHGNDTLVVMHTQKTGGTTFIRYLVTLKRREQYLCDLPAKLKTAVEDSHMLPRKAAKGDSSRAKQKGHAVTSCPRDPTNPDGEQWLIAASTVRWVCGLHASYTEYRSCLPALDNPRINANRRMHYAIILRHPVLRYLSEYFHVQRNATWSAPRICGGRPVSETEMPPCYPGYYEGEPWPNLTLSKYTSCESNWGNNRQTMMLADLESVHCFNKSAMSQEERDHLLLTTAKNNLNRLSFFGLTEYMSESCVLFEKTFGFEFAVRPDTRELAELHSGPVLRDLWNNTVLYEAIETANHLDMQLYEYALELFQERAGQVGIPVNKGLVEEELTRLKSDPKIYNKHKKLDFNIS